MSDEELSPSDNTTLENETCNAQIAADVAELWQVKTAADSRWDKLDTGGWESVDRVIDTIVEELKNRQWQCVFETSKGSQYFVKSSGVRSRYCPESELEPIDIPAVALGYVKDGEALSEFELFRDSLGKPVVGAKPAYIFNGQYFEAYVDKDNRTHVLAKGLTATPEVGLQPLELGPDIGVQLELSQEPGCTHAVLSYNDPSNHGRRPAIQLHKGHPITKIIHGNN